jgi:subtilisin-like proprotein convertase family protein
VLDPGETATLPITIRNSGDATATSVLGDLLSAYPDTLKVYGATASYADMPVAAQADSTSPHYSVTLEPSASCGQIVAANMAITGDGFTVGSGFTLDVGEYARDYPSSDTPLTIPRGGSVNSYINVPSSFPLTEIDVTLDIDHQDIGDLEVIFYVPGATVNPVYLHNNTGVGVSGIHTTYDTLTEPDGPGSLDAMIEANPQGNWRIKVNNAGNKTGTLQGWTLHLRSDTPFDCNPVGCAQGVPSPVGDTLTVDKSGSSDVRIGWSGVGSSDYNVWRSSDPLFHTAVHAGATGGATSFTDSGAQSRPGLQFYVARSVNSCRWESD